MPLLWTSYFGSGGIAGSEPPVDPPVLITNFHFIERSPDVKAWQSVATDGTHWYVVADWVSGSSQQWVLQKYDASWNLVDSRNTGTGPDAAHTQLSGIYYDAPNSRLVVAANNHPSTAEGWILEYDPSDLSLIAATQLTSGRWSEAVTFWNGSWWEVCANAHSVRQLDTDWSVIGTHALPDTSPGGLFWQGIIVIDDIFYLNLHYDNADTTGIALRAYSLSGSAFVREDALDVTKPTSYATQGMTYDGANTWWAERYISGTTAQGSVVKANAQVEVVPDPYVALQVEFTGADTSTTFTDDGDTGHTLTAVGNAQILSNKLELDGSGDWVIAARHPDFQFDISKGFTIEIWGFEPDAAGPLVSVYDSFTAFANHRCWFLTNSPNGTMRIGLFDDGTTLSDIVSHTWTPGVVDVAAVFDPASGGANTYLYINGTKVAEGTYAGDWLFLGNVPLTIGGLNTRATTAGNRQSLNGRMSAVRITHAALYTGASYSVPTLPL